MLFIYFISPLPLIYKPLYFTSCFYDFFLLFPPPHFPRADRSEGDEKPARPERSEGDEKPPRPERSGGFEKPPTNLIISNLVISNLVIN